MANIHFKFESWSKMRDDCIEEINNCIKEGRVYDYDDIIFENDSYSKELENSIVSIVISKPGKKPDSIPMYKQGDVISLLDATAYLYECVYGFIDSDKLKRVLKRDFNEDGLYALIDEGKNIWKIRQAIKDGIFYKESEISRSNAVIHYKDIDNLRWGIDGPTYQYKTESDIKERFRKFGGK